MIARTKYVYVNFVCKNGEARFFLFFNTKFKYKW